MNRLQSFGMGQSRCRKFKICETRSMCLAASSYISMRTSIFTPETQCSINEKEKLETYVCYES